MASWKCPYRSNFPLFSLFDVQMSGRQQPQCHFPPCSSDTTVRDYDMSTERGRSRLPAPSQHDSTFLTALFSKKTHRRKMRDGTLQIGSDSSYTFLFNEIFMKWSLWQFFSQRLKISPSLIPQWAVTVIIRYRVCRLKKVSGV